jgi:hypothetical protein
MMNMLKKFEKSGWDTVVSNVLLIVAIFCAGILAGVIYLNMGNPVAIKEIIGTQLRGVAMTAGICCWLAFFLNGVMYAVLDEFKPKYITIYSVFCVGIFVWGISLF